MLKSFSFLKDLSLVAAEKDTSVRASRAAVDRNPTTADLRLFKTGAIYPSKALIEEFDLQFRTKAEVEQKITGNGADVFSSVNWPNYPQGTENAIFIAFLPKSAAKISILGSTKFDKKGNPSDVATQGATTFGLSLIEMLKEVYGFEFTEDQKFVDLVILRDVQLSGPNGKTIVPKVVSRGAKQGELSYEIRENLVCMPLLIDTDQEENISPEESTADQEQAGPADDSDTDEDLTEDTTEETQEEEIVEEDDVAPTPEEEVEEEEAPVNVVAPKKIPFKKVAKA